MAFVIVVGLDDGRRSDDQQHGRTRARDSSHRRDRDFRRRGRTNISPTCAEQILGEAEVQALLGPVTDESKFWGFRHSHGIGLLVESIAPGGHPICPLFATYVSPTDEKKGIWIPIATTFAIKLPGVFLTAAHSVTKLPKTHVPMNVDNEYLLSDLFVSVRPRPDACAYFPVTDVTDCGRDIAILTVSTVDRHEKWTLDLASTFEVKQGNPWPHGNPLWWAGFPHLVQPKFVPDQEHMEVAESHAHPIPHRVHGIVSAYYPSPPAFAPGMSTPAYGLDRSVLPGMSGGPVVDGKTGEVGAILTQSAAVKIPATTVEGKQVLLDHAMGFAVSILDFAF